MRPNHRHLCPSCHSIFRSNWQLRRPCPHAPHRTPFFRPSSFPTPSTVHPSACPCSYGLPCCLASPDFHDSSSSGGSSNGNGSTTSSSRLEILGSRHGSSRRCWATRPGHLGAVPAFLLLLLAPPSHLHFPPSSAARLPLPRLAARPLLPTRRHLRHRAS